MKVKVNLASGNVYQKPLVSGFKNANGAYIVLDNEANGSMGLPIISISKFNGNEAIKIIDQGEWASVKESLKAIIAGNNIEYITVPEVISAQDDFYTQLTLPVASFDVLKNAYIPPVNVEAEKVEVAPVIEEAVISAPVMPVMSEAVTIEETAPVFTAPVMPEMPSAPVINEAVTINNIDQIKENFMKSCEAMFDALVQKLK